MHKEHASRFIFTTFAVMAALLVWALGVNAAQAQSTGAQLSIAGNGQTMMRYAEVVSVSGPLITVATVWGATQMTWIIETTGSTKFYPESSSREALKALTKGDHVSVTGILDMKTGRPTIRASVVRSLSSGEEGDAVSAARAENEIPAAAAPISEAIPATGEGTEPLVVSASSTALLAWLWRFLYGDPALVMAG